MPHRCRECGHFSYWARLGACANRWCPAGNREAEAFHAQNFRGGNMVAPYPLHSMGGNGGMGSVGVMGGDGGMTVTIQFNMSGGGGPAAMFPGGRFTPGVINLPTIDFDDAYEKGGKGGHDKGRHHEKGIKGGHEKGGPGKGGAREKGGHHEQKGGHEKGGHEKGGNNNERGGHEKGGHYEKGGQGGHEKGGNNTEKGGHEKGGTHEKGNEQGTEQGTAEKGNQKGDELWGGNGAADTSGKGGPEQEWNREDWSHYTWNHKGWRISK